jgi:vacuolar-type H+-ATPase subunit E/Vma4
MTSLVNDFDKDSPLIVTHPLVGAIAVSANFTNVINLVVDNHPQWFVVVPGALNLVQGPKLYRELMKMGVPDSEIELAGHWNPKEIVDNIETSTVRRIERIKSKKPLRLLVPVGGAGAQESFLADLVEACAALVKQGKLHLFLNAGDHDHFESTFKEQLEASKLNYKMVEDVNSLMQFNARLDSGLEPSTPVTLFIFNSTYPAVTTTDLLASHSDVLVCKPSEMAFYAVPKLMIRRVGDHEAKSAIRAAEVEDGTLEAETIEEIMKEINQFLTKPGDLITMNRVIQSNNEIGMYNGAKIAVERALERAT